MATCDRCGVVTRAAIMSKFNTDIICVACKEDERQAPGYEAADRAEVAAVMGGNYRFPGVGLSAADEVFLAERRQARAGGAR